MTHSLLKTEELKVSFGSTEILHGICMEVHGGEIIGIAGESGAGKSTLALALMNLVHFYGGKIVGEISFDGRSVLALREKEWRQMRGGFISLILQSPAQSFDPVYTIGFQLKEAIKYASSHERFDKEKRIAELLNFVRLPSDDSFLKKYPHQLSVGMLQRVAIVMSLTNHPRLLVADEPTSSVDVYTQQSIIQLFRDIRKEFGTAIVFISHDLPLLRRISDRILILKEGNIVEDGSVKDIFENPQHAYTRLLVTSVSW